MEQSKEESLAPTIEFSQFGKHGPFTANLCRFSIGYNALLNRFDDLFIELCFLMAYTTFA